MRGFLISDCALRPAPPEGSRPAPARTSLEVHAAHAAHAAAGSAVCVARVLLRNVGDHGFRRDQQTSNRSGILQRATHDLSRVDDALLIEIAVLVGLSVVAESV